MRLSAGATDSGRTVGVVESPSLDERVHPGEFQAGEHPVNPPGERRPAPGCAVQRTRAVDGACAPLPSLEQENEAPETRTDLDRERKPPAPGAAHPAGGPGTLPQPRGSR